MSKMTEEQFEKIKELHEEGKEIREIAPAVGCTHFQVLNAFRRIADAQRAENPETVMERQVGKRNVPIRKGLSKSTAAKRLFAENKDGIFITIRKEITPDNWRIMKRIDKFEGWTAIETEVFDLIRREARSEFERTKKLRTWTSGKYLVEVWDRTGKSKTYDDVMIDVNAGEDELLPAGASAEGTRDGDYLLAQSLSPEKVMEQNMTMFNKGLELSAQKEIAKSTSDNNMMTLMMGFMTEMIKNRHDDRGDFFTRLKEMRELGLVQSPDPFAQISKLKEFAGIFTELVGISAGDKPTMTERIVDLLVPKLPGIVTDLRKMSENVVQARQLTTPARSVAPAPPIQPAPAGPSEKPVDGGNEIMFRQMMDKLYQYVIARDYTRFDEITETLAPFQGGREAFLAKIKERSIAPENLCAYLVKFDKRYESDKNAFYALQDYATKYFASFEEHESIIATCPTCGAEFKFRSIQDWDRESSEAGGTVICGLNGCGGVLELERPAAANS